MAKTRPSLSPLPADSFKDQIQNWAKQDQSRVLLVQGETGSGKSTRVPRYLYDAGLDVVVTQPRRIAAITLAERVASEMGEAPGLTVGYATGGGDASARLHTDGTAILYVTDGLALIHEIMGKEDRACLILDEVHEWRIEGEVLIAWAKRELARDQDFRVVLMSATMDVPALSSFFSTVTVPTEIVIPGRTFPIEDVPMAADLPGACVAHAKAGRTVLAFEHGKAEIERAMTRIEAQAREEGVQVLCLPLHGQLTREEQRRAFAPAPMGLRKIVVATNVAQTSITIPDITAVVDGGMEKIGVSEGGIHGLRIVPISLASRAQRRGRAGRVQAGVYTDLCPAKIESRPVYDRPAIEREHLSSTILRLAGAGYKIGDLEFFHAPPPAQIEAATRELRLFGFLSEDGTLTAQGQAAVKIPLDPPLAAMVLAARQYGCVSEILDVVSILSVGGIVDNRIKDESTYGIPIWHKHVAGEQGSDVLAQLTLFRAAGKTGAKWREMGLHVKCYQDARRVRSDLVQTLRGHVAENRTPAPRENVIRAIVAGSLHRLYRRESGYGEFRCESDSQGRDLTRESLVRDATMGVGSPMDIPFETRRTGQVRYRYILGMFTSVTTAMLADVAPHLCSTVKGLRPVYDSSSDQVLAETVTRFGSVVLSKIFEPYQGPDASEVFARWMSMNSPEARALAEHNDRVRDLNARVGKTEFEIVDPLAYLSLRLCGAVRRAGLDTAVLAPPTLDVARMAEIESLYPTTVAGTFLPGSAPMALTVSYSNGIPTVRLGEFDATRGARDWPEHAHIPAGAEIQFEIVTAGWYSTVIASGTLGQCKAQLVARERKTLIEAQSEVFDVNVTEVPSEIESISVGESVITGEPILAFRALCWSSYHERFSFRFFADRDEAVREHDASILRRVRAEREQAERGAVALLVTEAEALRHQIERLGGFWSWPSQSETTIEAMTAVLNEGRKILAKAETTAKDRDRVQVVYGASPGEGLGGAMAAAFARSGQRRNRR